MQWHGLGDQLINTLTTHFGALLTLLAAVMAWFVGVIIVVRHRIWGLFDQRPTGYSHCGWYFTYFSLHGQPEIPERSLSLVGWSRWRVSALGYIMRFLSEGYAALKPGL